MIKNSITYFLLFALTLIGCDYNKSYEKLEEIDHLLSIEKPETAYRDISKIKAANLTGERDSAYYYLLKTQTLYRLYKPVTSDSMINYSINYYEKSADKAKLARAYYYKGVVIYDLGRTKEAVINMKKSETLALILKNVVLLHNVYEALTVFNEKVGEYELSLNYGKLTLNCSNRAQNSNWKAYALNNLIAIYGNLKMEKEASFYADKCISLLKYIPQSDWIFILTNIGTSYISINREKAKVYLQEALSIQKNSYAYFALATIYAKEGKNKKADAYWKEALKTKDLGLKKDVLQAMFDNECKEKDYKAACDISKRILANNEAIAAKKENDQVKETQMNYDSEMKIVRERQYIVYARAVALALALLILLLMLYNKYKSTKAKNDIMQTQMLIDSYAAEIGRLRTSNDSHHDEAETLKKKLDNLEKRQSIMLYKGHKLYEDIMSGGNMVTWHKDDFINFIEFYKMKDMSFVTHLEEDYDKLTPKNMFFEIMLHLGKTNEEIEGIMAITPSTRRSLTSRIKEKLKNDSQYIIALLLIIMPACAFGQAADTTTCHKRFSLHESYTNNITLTGLAFIADGLMVKASSDGLGNISTYYQPHFKTALDNCLEYAPITLTFALKALGVKSQSDWKRLAVNSAATYITMTAIVQSIKYTAKERRPDRTTRNSFPSGHTAMAFAGATILHKEYGYISPWVSICGYGVATLTGMARILHNRHWMNDVLVGAGTGIVSADMGYFIGDLLLHGKGKSNLAKHDEHDLSQRPSFISVTIGSGLTSSHLNTPEICCKYGDGGQLTKSANGINVKLKTGHSTSFNMEGAYYLNDYLGIGGRLRAMMLPVVAEAAHDNIALESSHLGMMDMQAGFFASLPIGCRLRIGTKLLAGNRHTTACCMDALLNVHKNTYGGDDYATIAKQENFIKIKSNNTPSWGTGLSVTFAYKSDMNLRAFIDYDGAKPQYTYSIRYADTTDTQKKKSTMNDLSAGVGIAFLF